MISRIRRILFGLSGAVSLLLCVTLAALWVRSYRTRTAVGFSRADGLWEVVSDRGSLSIDNEPQWRRDQEALHERAMAHIRSSAAADNERLAHAPNDSPEFKAIKARRAIVTATLHALWQNYDPKALQRLPTGSPESIREAKRLTGLYADLAWLGGSIRRPAPPVRRAVAFRTLVAATAALPALWLVGAARTILVRRRRRARLGKGLCAGCGYDLRGGGGRCPECGEAAVTAGVMMSQAGTQ